MNSSNITQVLDWLDQTILINKSMSRVFSYETFLMLTLSSVKVTWPWDAYLSRSIKKKLRRSIKNQQGSSYVIDHKDFFNELYQEHINRASGKNELESLIPAVQSQSRKSTRI